MPTLIHRLPTPLPGGARWTLTTDGETSVIVVGPLERPWDEADDEAFNVASLEASHPPKVRLTCVA